MSAEGKEVVAAAVAGPAPQPAKVENFVCFTGHDSCRACKRCSTGLDEYFMIRHTWSAG